MLQHVAVDRCYVAVEADRAGKDIGGGGKNAVVTGSGVVGKFDLGPPSEHCVVILKYLNHDRVEGGLIGSASVASRSENAFVFAVSDQFAEFNPQYQVVIGLIEVDDL